MELFWKGKTHIIAKLHRTDLVISSHSTEVKTLSYTQINMVTTTVGCRRLITGHELYKVLFKGSLHLPVVSRHSKGLDFSSGFPLNTPSMAQPTIQPLTVVGHLLLPDTWSI